jgi:hypothetical protein
VIKTVSLLLTFGAAVGVGAAASHIQARAPFAWSSTAPQSPSSDGPTSFEPFARRKVEPVAPSDGHGAPPLSLLTVELEPIGVNKGAAGESLVLELEVSADKAASARARYAFELVDDLGVEVVKATQSAIFAVGKDKPASFRLTAPVLSDGFYVARATVVADSGDDHDGAVRQVMLEARGGDVNPVDIEVFNERSRAKQGHP